MAQDIGPVIPIIARAVRKFYYLEEELVLVFMLDDLYVHVEPRKVSISGVVDEARAAEAMERVNRLLTDAANGEKSQAA